MATASAPARAIDPPGRTAPTAPEERPALHTSNPRLLTFGILAATLMQILDSTIANVALPHMAASLGATQDTVTWILTSYIVATAVAIPITGWLSDRIGSRNLFLAAIVGFVVASMLCGMATSLAEIVAFRVLQGIAAAFMNPLGQTAMMDIHPKSKQAGAMAIWGMGIMVGPILGPIIGGFLTESYSWRWCFYVNVPVGSACFAILWALLPTRARHARRFDLFGFAMLAIAISALQLMLDRGQTNDWFASWEVWAEAMIALGAGWMFFVHQLTGNTAMFERAIFADRNLIAGIGFMFVVGVLSTATMALLPLMLQSLFGYPVLSAGMLLAPRGFGIIPSMWLAGRLGARGIDPRLLIGTGLVLVTLSLWDMTGWTLSMSAGYFVTSGVIQGIGLGLIFIPLNILAFATLPAGLRTEGASLTTLARSLGGSIGISVVTTLLAKNVQTQHEVLGAHLPDPGLLANDPVAASLTGSGTDTILAIANGIVNQQAAMVAYLDDFKLMMILTVCSLPLVLLLRRPKGPAAVPDPDAMGH